MRKEWEKSNRERLQKGGSGFRVCVSIETHEDNLRFRASLKSSELRCAPSIRLSLGVCVQL